MGNTAIGPYQDGIKRALEEGHRLYYETFTRASRTSLRAGDGAYFIRTTGDRTTVRVEAVKSLFRRGLLICDGGTLPSINCFELEPKTVELKWKS